LVNFLVQTKYDELLSYLMAEKSKFEKQSIYNRKSTFELIKELKTDITNPIGQLHQILTSDHFFLMLSNWTGLKLHPQFVADSDDEEESDEEDKLEPTGGAVRSVTRRWEHTNYTLLHDADTSERASLDLFLHFIQDLGYDVWDINKGGSVIYITKGEDEQLLQITPKANALSLVYRDSDTLRFVKYLNKKTAKDHFFEVFNCYYE
jgi:hypothetical protein